MPSFDGGGGVGGSRREDEEEQGVASAATFNAPTCSTNRVRQLASSWPPLSASTATEDDQDGNKAQKQGELEAEKEKREGGENEHLACQRQLTS